MEEARIEEMLQLALADIDGSAPIKLPDATRDLISAWLGRFWSMGSSYGKEDMIAHFTKKSEADELVYLAGFNDGVNYVKNA